MARQTEIIKPNTALGQLLQALRSTTLEPGQISERWASGSTNIRYLVSLGYAESYGGRFTARYRITEAGRAACPERRAA